VAAERAASAKRTTYWTLDELSVRLPALKVPRKRFERRAEWKLAANIEARAGSSLQAMLDGEPNTEYRTQGAKPFPIEWLTVELPARSKILGIEIDSGDGWARGYSVEVSDDGENWNLVAPNVVGEQRSRANFDVAAEGRHLRIAITQKDGWQPWVIKELNLFGDER
jgi:hypothetical protein